MICRNETCLKHGDAISGSSWSCAVEAGSRVFRSHFSSRHWVLSYSTTFSLRIILEIYCYLFRLLHYP